MIIKDMDSEKLQTFLDKYLPKRKVDDLEPESDFPSALLFLSNMDIGGVRDKEQFCIDHMKAMGLDGLFNKQQHYNMTYNVSI